MNEGVDDGGQEDGCEEDEHPDLLTNALLKHMASLNNAERALNYFRHL